eukprot:GEMP01094429.1.p1 GENE.GEMP01094429.1~~GEMP01094429.1.p1  ORF type:complete len:205 (+),score=60.20 GEMP01094429.1:116-730(+)
MMESTVDVPAHVLAASSPRCTSASSTAPVASEMTGFLGSVTGAFSKLQEELSMSLYNDLVPAMKSVLTMENLTIHEAAYEGDLDRVAILLAEGADVNLKEELTLMTPLHHACRAGHLSIVRHLLEQDAPEANVNARDAWHGTALHAASAEGHANIVRGLLNLRGIEISARNKFRQTPLDLAMKYNHQIIVQLLRGRLQNGEKQI